MTTILTILSLMAIWALFCGLVNWCEKGDVKMDKKEAEKPSCQNCNSQQRKTWPSIKACVAWNKETMENGKCYQWGKR